MTCLRFIVLSILVALAGVAPPAVAAAGETLHTQPLRVL